MSSGIFVALAGVWLIAQVTKGGLLDLILGPAASSGGTGIAPPGTVITPPPANPPPPAQAGGPPGNTFPGGSSIGPPVLGPHGDTGSQIPGRVYA